MQETILKLITLQDLDNKIRTWRLAAEEGPAKIQAAREKLTALEAEKAVLDEKLAANAKGRRELETLTEDLAMRQTTNQARQLKARNNNEYRAVMKEADTINSTLAAKEDELLTFMAEAEKLQAVLPPLAADIEAEAKIFAEREAAIMAVIQEGQTLEAEATQRRQGMLAGIPPAFLGRYNTIAQNRDGQAMAPVVQGMCRVCRLSIPPQLYNELQKNDKLLTCPNCARILYWMHHPYFKDFCTEPNPQELTATTDKTEKKSKADNGKRRKASKPKEPKEEAKNLEDDDSDNQSPLDDRTVAHL
ncbi:MAG: C4-type zinc ribbon domain-containing protein [Deltaproteobacteria bacterium]|nr:C4-type zinc ribbon domain-containing protein [Deltaproteobacteria bacterium]